jgi:hypothetical protein
MNSASRSFFLAKRFYRRRLFAKFEKAWIFHATQSAA